MALLTPADVKLHLRDIQGTVSDTYLTTLIARAQVGAAKWLGWIDIDSTAAPDLEEGTYTERLDGPPRDDPYAIQLTIPYASAITSVHISAAWSFTASTVVGASDYYFESRNSRIYVKRDNANSLRVVTAPRAIQVVYTGGWDTDSVPGDVEEALALIVVHWYRTDARQGKTSMSLGGASASYEEGMGLPTQAMHLLARYAAHGYKPKWPRPPQTAGGGA